MHEPGCRGWSRRDFLTTVAGASAALGATVRRAEAEPPPETTKIRLVKVPAACVAPQYVAAELLKTEGFTEVEYVDVRKGPGTVQLLASGQADVSIAFIAPFLIQADAGAPIVLLAGVHVGCFEFFGGPRVRTVRDLRGKKVSVAGLGSSAHVFVSTIAAHVGLDPRRDIEFLEQPAADGMRLLAAGRVDAYLGFPPDPQELRAKKVGRVILNSAVDRPWSQYFCCVATGNRDFVQRHPVAVKRALRAILKATDVCALEPQRVARMIVDRGVTTSYDYALQTMKDVPFRKWRAYDPEDAARFYALRLHEVGMVKSNPQQLIAQAADWQFVNALKKELKG